MIRWALIAGFLIGLLVGFFVGAWAMWQDCKREAVKHNAAHWKVSKDGKVSCHWNDEKHKEK